MKPREDRRKVMVTARMRAGAAWSDVRILDMSTRGIGGESTVPPAVGAYLEVRRGPNIIVARVVWARQQRFGARCQDHLAIDSFLAEEVVPQTKAHFVERRAVARPTANVFETSRQSARMLEFGGLAVVGLGMALVGLSAVQEALAKPLAAVMSAIG